MERTPKPRSHEKAFSRQPSAKPLRWLRSTIVLAFALAFQLTLSTFASDNCSHKVWNWKVDKKAALQLQQFVNEGHESWRVDDTATVAGQAVNARKKEWSDYSPILGAAKPISETKDVTVMIATSEDGRVRYEVTLRKYSWLLHSAKKWQ
jgi:hypothetical protein